MISVEIYSEGDALYLAAICRANIPKLNHGYFILCVTLCPGVFVAQPNHQI